MQILAILNGMQIGVWERWVSVVAATVAPNVAYDTHHGSATVHIHAQYYNRAYVRSNCVFGRI